MKPGSGTKDTSSSSRNCSFPQATGYALILGALRNDSVEGASAIDVGWKQKRAVAVTLVTSAAASFATVGLLTLGSVRYVLVSILGVPANVKFLVLPFVLVGSFVLLLAALVGDLKVCGAFLRSSSGRAAAFERVSHKGLVTGAEGSRYAFAKAKATLRVDVAETPVFGTDYELEGKSVKEPSVPEVFPVFVRSLLGPHLGLSRLRLHSCFLLGIGCRGAHWGP